MNTPKAVRLLQIPDECAAFESVIRTRTQRSLIITEVWDFTVSPRKITYEPVYVKERVDQFGAYTLNQISNYIHGYGHDITELTTNSMKMSKPPMTLENGQWFNGANVSIDPTAGDNGFTFDIWSGIGLNANPDGSIGDINDPYVMAGVFYRVQKSITRNNLGQIKTWTSKPQYVKWKVSQLRAATGMSEAQIAYATRTSWNATKVDNNTFITSIAMEIRANGSTTDGVFHINGVPANDLSVPLIASYGQPALAHKFRWLLYNHAPTGPTIYGQSVMAEFTGSESTTITVVEGDVDKYDSATAVMTFDANYPANAKLVATAEFYPAQGKNETAGAEYYPETGMTDIWA